MNEPTPAPAIDVAAALHAAPPAPEDVVYPSVPPAPSIEGASAPAEEVAKAEAVEAPPAPLSGSSIFSSEDQLPTSRFPSLPHALPPLVPPPGPAHKTQPLRPITREDAAAKLASDAKAAKRAKRDMLKAKAAGVTRAALGVPSHLARLGRAHAATWTRTRVGVVCALTGALMIAWALVLGWSAVASDHLDKTDHASLAVAVVLARAALAIAAMGVGYGLLRVGERTLTRGESSLVARRGNGFDGDAN